MMIFNRMSGYVQGHGNPFVSSPDLYFSIIYFSLFVTLKGGEYLSSHFFKLHIYLFAITLQGFDFTFSLNLLSKILIYIDHNCFIMAKKVKHCFICFVNGKVLEKKKNFSESICRVFNLKYCHTQLLLNILKVAEEQIFFLALATI